jgi:[CysO sulfur-carrier protein]-S-L-cysteine hydrolase
MGRRFILRIPSTIYHEMIAHARTELPNECVGMLVGSADGVVRNRYPLVNELQSPERFLTEARSMLAAEKRLRAEQQEVLAIYHSHPRSSPVPSRYDVADHYGAEVMSVIVSLEGEAADVKGWWIEGGMFWEGEVVVE